MAQTLSIKWELIKGNTMPKKKSLGSPTHLEKLKIRGSTAIHRIDYTDENVLVVYMIDGSKLEYGDVPRTIFDDFQKAESKGKFFNSRIRNSYPFLG